jgi:hypothetical protein
MIRHARCGEARLNDARFWHPWLRINRVLRVMVGKPIAEIDAFCR